MFEKYIFQTNLCLKKGMIFYMDFKQWEGFNYQGEWTKEIDVRGFIQANYTPYELSLIHIFHLLSLYLL